MILSKFKKQLSPMGEKAYNEYQCQQMIKDSLDFMKNDGFKFCYSSQQRNFQQKWKQMTRNRIYLRFNCTNCQVKEKRKMKRFTSILGTITIFFQFRKKKEFHTKYDLLCFHLRIYSMECLNCLKYGIPEIYDSQLEKIQKQFTKIIANILNKIPPKKPNRNKKPIQVPDLHHHRHQRCQACKVGKCHQGKCPKKT